MFIVAGCLASASDNSPPSAGNSGPTVPPAPTNGARRLSASAWHCQNMNDTLGEMGPIYKLCFGKFHDVTDDVAIYVTSSPCLHLVSYDITW